MDKKKWVRPVLTVLTRGGSQEMVLYGCKWLTAEPQAPRSTYMACIMWRRRGGCYENCLRAEPS